jgi:Ran GTPase-activating protein (RanGAP) involved in mRNA processing and transport
VLEKLNLGDNRIGGKDDEPGIRALAEALQINTTITELNLAFTHLDSECAYLLAPAIRSNRAMTSLDVSDNDLESEGAKHIAAAIPECE